MSLPTRPLVQLVQSSANFFNYGPYFEVFGTREEGTVEKEAKCAAEKRFSCLELEGGNSSSKKTLKL